MSRSKLARSRLQIHDCTGQPEALQDLWKLSELHSSANLEAISMEAVFTAYSYLHDLFGESSLRVTRMHKAPA